MYGILNWAHWVDMWSLSAQPIHLFHLDPVMLPGNKLIESGSAFFVHSSGAAGGVTFTEPCKGDTNYLVQRQNEPIQYFRTNLYSVAVGWNP